MYFEDRTPYRYLSLPGVPPASNIGWLSSDRAFDTGSVSEKILERLWNYCKISVAATRGIHTCELCGDERANRRTRGDDTLFLGTAEIRVVSSDATTFAAPNLIYHYVADHRYLPPREFVEALTSGVDPSGDAYGRQLDEMKYVWERLPSTVRSERSRE